METFTDHPSYNPTNLSNMGPVIDCIVVFQQAIGMWIYSSGKKSKLGI